MKCGLCKDMNPTHHFTISLRYTMVKVDLCAACADKLGVTDPTTGFDNNAIFKALCESRTILPAGPSITKIQAPKGGG